MKRVRLLIALLMATFWLPATQHCLLEAAGVLPQACADEGCLAGERCADDGCAEFEDGLYKSNTDLLKVRAPTLRDCACLRSAVLVPPLPDDAGILPPKERERPLDWVPTWQFEHRAALPPGAPSSSVA